MSAEDVARLAQELRAALTQWVLEPWDAPRSKIGLTTQAERTMNAADELLAAMGIPAPYFSQQ